MLQEKTNIKYKDALFKVVFGENPANAMSLYNAINNTEYTNVEDLEIKTRSVPRLTSVLKTIY